MTYGDLKFRLTQAFPSISLDLIEGWIGDRYQEILGELPWSRLDVQAVLQTAAPYSTGTAVLTNGSTSVVLTGGTWTTAMSGRAFRVTPRSEFYEFSFGTATTGSLDRPYEGPTSAAAAYSIFQAVYAMPADCVMLEANAFNSALGQLTRTTHGELNQSDPWRLQRGTPRLWASYMDDSSTPPRMQVELYPVPDQAVGLPFTYTAAAGDLTLTATILQIWMEPGALVEGVTGKCKAQLKDYVGAQYHGAEAARLLKGMRGTEAQGMAPAKMQLDPYYTGHRAKRYCR